MNQKQIDEMLASQERYQQIATRELEEERIRRMQLQNNQAESSGITMGKEPNLVEFQLELKDELDKIYHLLSGHVLVFDEKGNEIWGEPQDDRLKIFSEYGVKQMMNVLAFYINRNTLLSFYDEETISWKVRDFGNEINDLILEKYEYFFYYPTPEELYEKALPLIKKNQLKINEEELYMKCVQWSKEELQSKIRHYSIIVKCIIDSVDSTYRRALKGEERDSLRKFMHISQNANTTPSITQQRSSFSFFKPGTWGGA